MNGMRAFFLLVLVACGGGSQITIDGHVVYESRWQESADAVRNRAAFDFECPRDEIELTLVASRPWRRASHPIRIGAQGCGHRGVYAGYRTEWTADSLDCSHIDEGSRSH